MDNIVTDNTQALINADAKIKELEQQLAESQASNAQYRDILEFMVLVDEIKSLATRKEAIHLLKSTQKQSLVHIKAEAIEDIMPDKIIDLPENMKPKYALGWNDYHRELRLRINQLRNSAKGGE